MYPIILTCGTPHSYTSMTSKFLQDNGGYCDDNWDNPKFHLPYSRFESKEIQEFVYARKNFKKHDLTEFFKGLPTDKIVTIKAPLLINFVNELSEFTDRDIKVVFVFRNPQDIILSSIDKKNKGFIYYFERLAFNYQAMVDCKFPVFPLVAEKLLLKDEHVAKSLLEYCGLYKGEINFSSIKTKEVKKRNTSFLDFRFSNFFWKRLARFFMVYEVEDEAKNK